MPKHTDPAVERDIIAWYSAGHTATATADLFGVMTNTVLRILRRNGVAARTNSESHVGCTLRHDAFDLLTPDAAYWCGFLFADGAVNMRSGTPMVSVGITAADRRHLEKLRSFLGSTHAILLRPGRASRGYISRPSVLFEVRSERLAGRILELGRYGGPLNPDLARSRDFWRGVVDGDGTVGFCKGYPSCRVVGSEWLMRDFAEFISDLAGPRQVKVSPHKSIYGVSTAGAFGERVLRRLYGDAATSLDRKAAVAAQILAVAKFTARATECTRGHAFDEANTGWENGKRRCKKCAARGARIRRQMARERALSMGDAA